MSASRATIILSTVGVASGLDLGGYFWVYMQYAQGLRELGCDVYWLDRDTGTDRDPTFSAFFDEMARYDLGGKCAVAVACRPSGNGGMPAYAGMPVREIEAIAGRTDLLINFDHRVDSALLSRFRRTAFVDLDPGLCQIWIQTGQLPVAPHDLYFTIGETVGTPSTRFPDNGLPWIRIRPAVCLTLWPVLDRPQGEAFTTVSSWWGGWMLYGEDSYDDSKRASFLRFLELPHLTPQALELTLSFTPHHPSDVGDQALLERHGWRIRRSFDVVGSPEGYRTYIQQSRGEFSCAKRSYRALQTAWVSDRTVCYLASGKPAVVQHTGASTFLPDGRGLLRFTTLAEAVDALATINAEYERHCRAAREIADAYFSARDICRTILDHALR